jgi:hypothetical protein
VLGDLNDASVAQDWLRSAVDKLDPQAVFVAGGLAQVMALEGTQRLGDWRKAYRRASRRELLAWFR